MGLLDILQGQRDYLDTNIFIYALEGFAEFRDILQELFEHIDRGRLHAITSELTLAEALIKPLQDRSQERQNAFEQALQDSATRTIVPISRVVLIESARLCALSGLRLPDAIHATTARLTGCSSFLTNDQRLRAVPNLHVVILAEIDQHL